jgi:hypothetical protein
MTPQKTPKQKRTFMGFPGTFARLKSRLSLIAENKVRYGPNGPGNQAPGRPVSMLARMARRGMYSIKFRSTCTARAIYGENTCNFDANPIRPVALFVLAIFFSQIKVVLVHGVH